MTEKQIEMIADESFRILREKPHLNYEEAIKEAKDLILKGGEKNVNR